jgi:hypothetical protein
MVNEKRNISSLYHGYDMPTEKVDFLSFTYQLCFTLIITDKISNEPEKEKTT